MDSGVSARGHEGQHGPLVITPRLRVIGPLPRAHLPVYQHGQGHSDRAHPDDDDRVPSTSLNDMSLHREYYSKESVTGYEGERKDAGDQRQNCGREEKTA